MFANIFAKRLLRLGLLGVGLAVFSLLGACRSVAPTAFPQESEEEGWKPYEGMEALRSKLSLYTDGKGHYLALPETNPKPGSTYNYPDPIFWGTERMFFSQRTHGRSGTIKPRENEGEPEVFLSFEVTLWNPRIQSGTVVKKENGELSISCEEKRKTLLKPVPAEEAKAFAEKAQFYTERWYRMNPHLTARDDTGTYYYIDRYPPNQKENFRLFIGKRGALKPVKLNNIVRDSAGEIFATPSGSLYVDSNARGIQGIYWGSGEKKQALVQIPFSGTYKELSFLWDDLGLYANQKLGPCDDI
ncbi:MAG: hypothetical protein FWC28_06030 [Proteobacteria bacterium]|nr:hypothetical protein [Cystobacterineae bacterium]MCL2258814.1 hypothetical protein [Cystobacterineae bacterium]MCL2314791.1 hypothetical protein [Pseudomonadota bacterium]